MQQFVRITDAYALVRLKGGIEKMSPIFHRKGNIYVKHCGGFVRVSDSVGDTWPTSVRGMYIIDISPDIPGLFVSQRPRWVGEVE
jgi:hypothetical protein